MNTYYLGVVYISLHSLLDVMFYATCKYDSEKNSISSFFDEVMFVLSYNIKALIVLILLFFIKNLVKGGQNFAEIKQNKLDQVTVRTYIAMCLFSVLGFVTFLYGLKDIMMANAMSIKYIEQALWVLVGVMILKETLTRQQIAGILISISGIAFIISSKVKTNGDFLTYVLPLIAAVCWTISSNIGKYIVKDQPDILLHMIYYYFFHIVVLILLSALLICFINRPESINIKLGSYEFVFHILSMTFFYKALRISMISLLAPFIYIKLLVSALLGHFIFLDEYELLELFAYMLIVFGGIKVLHTLKKSKVVIKGQDVMQ